MLLIEDLNAWLDQAVIDLYRQRGIAELYPPQAEAVERGILEGKNMMMAIPTAAGKTLLAELAMLKAAREGRRSLYIVPLRALASEKFESFRRFRSLGITVGISTGDFDRKDEGLGKNQIIVATSEKADSLIRNGASWMREIGVLVVDEIHLLNSANRGPTLEMTITKLMRLNPDMQVIGLSATVANAQEIADWLGAEMIISQWRPVRLREGILLKGKAIFPDGEEDVPGQCRDETLDLVRDTLGQGGQLLIFENSRRNAEATAIRLAASLGQCGSPNPDKARKLAERISGLGESETARRLAGCLACGTAFHHAGLLAEQRAAVEQGFRENAISVIASTPTLAAGLNLPARRVLIKSYRRYEAGAGMLPIPVIEYRQMSGRAGRPGLDPYGESLILAKNQAEAREVMDHYVLGEPEEIWSKLASESALRTHVLATIAAGFVANEDDLGAFMGSTFFAHQQDRWHLDATLEKVLSFLEEAGMIVGESGLHPTRLGSLVSRLYLDPLSALTIINRLRVVARPSDLTLIHLISMTPNMELLYIQQADRWVEEFIWDHEAELNPEENYDWMLREVKTSAMLMDWIAEVREDVISERYRIGPGDVRRVAETAEWLMGATFQLSRHLDLGATYLAQRLAQRIRYGAGPELLALLELRGIGRVRARKLYQAGITSLDKMREASPEHLAALLGPRIAENVLQQLSEQDSVGGG
ncbi:MAG: putative ski2-type helicase [Methanosaeta sp. PtaB.Bin039]|nr:MAG: putative ski2-type helicase [Methanosaeta sp. PtaB.Bin039]HOT07548.1 ATP-dependent DNA helicase [Methanotrichaceae archaeon]HQI53779.1 ATP-dependent DNA helicase [Methanothrix soehngenii]HQF16426.1 ATP-dependent DNA helicase [Methanotrichaceae archaeon]HQI91184.1 ATP-dependent DNA helicase [Methanotrichaceae archaeon]